MSFFTFSLSKLSGFSPSKINRILAPIFIAFLDSSEKRAKTGMILPLSAINAISSFEFLISSEVFARIAFFSAISM